MPELKLKTRTVHHVWYADLNDFIEEVYGRPYNLAHHGEYYNGTMEIHDPAEPYEDDEYLQEDLDRWLSAAPLPPHPGYTVSSEELKAYRKLEVEYEKSTPHFNVIMWDLHRRGLIPRGDYLIDISW